jgi:two-component system, cell cycle sensor histidine kinase and response regulator CckA
LGLATVYGIVRQSHGAIGVESAPGQGAAVSIYLPRVAPVVKPATPAPSATELPGGSETILLAEDNPGVRALARQMLTSLGYTVLEAENGRRALQRASAHPGPIHLLLTDLVMPEMGGVALVERLRATRPQTRVLFMSGYTDEVAADHGLPEPGTVFVQKPFKLHDVALKVRQVLDSASAA